MRFFSEQESAALEFLRIPALRYELQRCAVSFAILMAVGAALGQLQPALRDQFIGQFGVDTETAGITAVDLLGSGLITCGFGILVGLIPFVPLPSLLLGANAMLQGLLMSWYGGQGYSLPACLLSVIPHGIFQIPAMVIAFAMGLHLCSITTASVLKRRTDVRLRPALGFISGTFFQLVFPLLAAAALAELFVTPRILSLFSPL